MKIHIKSNDGFGFKLWLPTSILKSKFILNKFKKYGEIDIEPLINSLPIIYTALKEYIMKNGHFIFVDIESSDGNNVFIKV